MTSAPVSHCVSPGIARALLAGHHAAPYFHFACNLGADLPKMARSATVRESCATLPRWSQSSLQ